MKHQHYIPKSFLKNFAHMKDRRRVVDLYQKDTETLREEISISDALVSKNIYTITNPHNGDKFALEKFYGKNIDDIYPEVYKLLTDKRIINISETEKLKILNCCLSFYFRTPKHLKYFNNLSDKLLDDSTTYANPQTSIVNLEFFGEKLEFHVSELPLIKKKIKEKNKKNFHSSQLEVWTKLVSSKFRSAISVYCIKDNVELITSDNPVYIGSNIDNSNFYLFDPDISITMALDRSHFLMIMPSSLSSDFLRINRESRNKDFALTMNFKTNKNADNFLVGYPGSLKKHLNEQIEFNRESPENLTRLENSKIMVKEMSELFEIIEKVGGIAHLEVANKVIEMHSNPIFKDEFHLGDIIEELEKNGFKVI